MEFVKLAQAPAASPGLEGEEYHMTHKGVFIIYVRGRENPSSRNQND